MTSMRSCLLSLAPLALLASATVPANADAIFNFQNVPAGSTAPYSSTVNGLTASVSGSASVCDVTPLGFATLSGNALIQDYCNPPQLGPVTISFSSNLTGISFNFATAFSPNGTLTLQALLNGASVGTAVFNSTVPPGNFPNGEGVASFTGTFNSLVLTPSSILAVDNINAMTGSTPPTVPEPASVSMFAAGGLALLAFARRMRKQPLQ